MSDCKGIFQKGQELARQYNELMRSLDTTPGDGQVVLKDITDTSINTAMLAHAAKQMQTIRQGLKEGQDATMGSCSDRFGFAISFFGSAGFSTAVSQLEFALANMRDKNAGVDAFFGFPLVGCTNSKPKYYIVDYDVTDNEASSDEDAIPADEDQVLNDGISADADSVTDADQVIEHDEDVTMPDEDAVVDEDGIEELDDDGLALDDDELVADEDGLVDEDALVSDDDPLPACIPDINGMITHSFPDANFLNAIRTYLGKGLEDGISAEEAATTTVLAGKEMNVSNISGVQCFVNLERFSFDYNQIADISELSSLTHLQFLNLNHNLITDFTPLSGLVALVNLQVGANLTSDLSPLSNLTNVELINVGKNGVTDISPLAAMTKLKDAALGVNKISDISALANLVDLRELYMAENLISDISALRYLDQLAILSLGKNSISDITPLIENSGLGEGDEADLSENPIPQTQIDALKAKGVDVTF